MAGFTCQNNAFYGIPVIGRKVGCFMSVVIGIDIGGSSTKIVGFSQKGSEWELIEPQIIKANDPITATYGAFGKFTDENNLGISDISKVMMTGVGASHVKHNLYGLECVRVAEFDPVNFISTIMTATSVPSSTTGIPQKRTTLWTWNTLWKLPAA